MGDVSLQTSWLPGESERSDCLRKDQVVKVNNSQSFLGSRLQTLAVSVATMLSQNPSGDPLRSLPSSVSASSRVQLTAGDETRYKHAAHTPQESRDDTQTRHSTHSISVSVSTSLASINTARSSSFRSGNKPHFKFWRLESTQKSFPGFSGNSSAHQFVAGVPQVLREPEVEKQSNLRVLLHYSVQPQLTDEIFPQCFFRNGVMDRILLFSV